MPANLKDVNLISYPINPEDEEMLMKKSLGIGNFETTKVFVSLNKLRINLMLKLMFQKSLKDRKLKENIDNI